MNREVFRGQMGQDSIGGSDFAQRGFCNIVIINDPFF